MLKIRLMRFGKKKQPSFRLVVSDNKKDLKGKFIESLGFYNPRIFPKEIKLNIERIKYWLSQGVQMSPTVYNILVNKKIISGKKVKATKKHLKEEKELLKLEEKTPSGEKIEKEHSEIENPIKKEKVVEEKKEIKTKEQKT